MRSDTAIFTQDDSVQMSASEFENGSGTISIHVDDSKVLTLFIGNEKEFNNFCKTHNIKAKKND